MKLASALVLLALLAGFTLCLSSLQNIKTSYEVSQFIPKSHPLLRASASIERRFALNMSSSLVVVLSLSSSEAGDWLSPKRVAAMREATQNISGVAAVRRVISLGNIETAVTRGEEIAVGNVFSMLPAKEWRSEIRSSTLLTPYLLSKDGRHMLFVVEPKSANLNNLPHVKNKISQLLKQSFPQAQFQFGGVPMVQTEVSALLNRELLRSFLFSALFIVLVFIFLFSTFSSVVPALLLTMLANGFALTVLHLVGIPITVLTATVPILVAVNVIGICMHVQLKVGELQEHSASKLDKLYLLKRAYRELFLPNLLASVATSLGFATLTPSSIPLIREYGWAVVIVMAVAWVVTTTGLLPLLYLLPLPQARNWANRPARWSLWLIRYNKSVIVTISLLAITLAYAGQKLHWTARLFDDLPSANHARMAMEKIDRSFGGTIPMHLELTAREKNHWLQPRHIESLVQLSKQIEKFKGVGSVLGAPDLFKGIDGNLPRSRQALAEVELLYSLASANPLRHYLSTDQKATRLEIRLQDRPGQQVMAVVERIKTAARQSCPTCTVAVGGLGVTAHPINNEVAKELIFGFWHALVVIGLLLALYFRSWRWAVLACLPNLVPPAALLGFIALAKLPVEPSVAIIFSISMGFAFGNTVYLLYRVRKMQKAPRTLHIRRAFYLETHPCLLATIVLLAGFSVFMGSGFSLNQTFGLLMCLSIIAGLVGDLILLPALMQFSKPFLLAKPIPLRVFSGAFFLAVLAAGWYAVPSFAKEKASGDKLLAEFLQKTKSRDESLSLTLSIIEPSGDKKDRKLEIKRLSTAQEQKVLARLMNPPDLKGTAFLNVSSKNKDNQWIYLPSSKQVRRISGANREDSGILGSELTVADLDPATFRGAKAKLLPGNIVEVKPANTKIFAKIKLSFDPKTALPKHVVYLDKRNKSFKTITFTDYKSFNGVWRAQKIRVHNLRNKRKTDIVLHSAKINTDLDPEEFTPENLESL